MPDPKSDVENSRPIKGLGSKGDGIDADPGQASDRTYDPSTVQATRSRMQGLGVGASDLDRQRDPTRADSTRKGD